MNIDKMAVEEELTRGGWSMTWSGNPGNSTLNVYDG